MTKNPPCKLKGTGECDCLSHMGDTACVQEWPQWSASTMPKVEPPAEIRQLATMIFATYTAYIEAGFTAEQAMRLIEASIRSAGNGSQ